MQKESMPLRLIRDDIMKVLEMSDCMEATEKAFTELAAGTAVQTRIGTEVKL